MAAFLVVSVVVHGCSPAPSAPGWEGTIEEVDGVVRVTNPERGLWEGRESEPLRFVLERTFGVDQEPDEAILADTGRLHVGVDGAGNVYVLDGQQSRIVAFAPDGTVRWTAGREGQGPGEIQEAFGMAVSDAGRLAIANHMRSRVDFWDLEGSYLDGFSLEEGALGDAGLRFPLVTAFVDAGTLVLDSPIFGAFATEAVLIGTDPPAVELRCPVNDLPDEELSRGLSAGPDLRWQSGRVLAGSTNGYRLRSFDARCRPLREITRPVDYPMKPGAWEEGSSRGTAGYDSVGAPVILPSGRWLVAVRWIEGIDDPVAHARQRSRAFRAGERPEPLDWNSSVDLFDAEGRFLLSRVEEGAVYPSLGRIQLVGPDGKLYTTHDDPFPQVRRYRVEIDGS